MRFGCGAVNSLGVDDPLAVRDYAQAADDLGFDFVTLIDHVVTAYPGADGTPRFHYPTRTPYEDILVTLGYLAGVTRHIRLRTAVVIMPLRNPILVAKQAAAADALSGGRIDLGVGIGSHRLEYEAMGIPWSQRGSRLDEGVDIAIALWTRERIDHSGRHFTLDGMAMEPKPVQQPHPPLWFGGTSAANHHRVARYGQGWISRPVQSREEVAAAWGTIRRSAADMGRNSDELRMQVTVPVTPAASPAEIAGDIMALRSIGATDVVLFTSYAEGLDTPQDHIRELQRIQAEVLPIVAE